MTVIKFYTSFVVGATSRKLHIIMLTKATSCKNEIYYWNVYLMALSLRAAIV